MSTATTAAETSPADASPTVRVSRQPILGIGETQDVHGYELQFSDGGGLFDAFADVDDERATTEVLGHTVLTLGLDRVVGDGFAFIRFPRQQVIEQAPLMLPPEKAVVQLGPDAWGEGDRQAVADACAQLKAAGYRICLTEFAWDPAVEPVLAHADYIAIDVRGRSEIQLVAAIRVVRQKGAAIVATHVDDEERRDLVVRAGAEYVQGFYFAAPGVVEGRELPGFKLTYLQLLRAAYTSDPDFEEIADIVKRDVSLSYKLLKYVNSAHFGLRGEITSVRHALTMLGQKQMRSWVGVATVSGMVHPRTQELAVLCATRARFCESLGERLGVASPHECFSVGMFSLLDVMLGKTVDEVLLEVPVSDAVAQSLRGEPGTMTDLLGVIVAYERGDWDTVSQLCAGSGWPEADLIGLYIDAIEWSRDFFGADVN